MAVQTIPRLKHGKVDEALRAYTALAQAVEKQDMIEKIAVAHQRYRLKLFCLVMVGEIKKGKSSLINALLGIKELVPTGEDITTSTVFKIVYGPALRYRVFFLPDDPNEPEVSRPEPIDIPAADIASYGTEMGNPRNKRNVDFIAIEHPHRLLKEGLAIVDLPGLGGLIKEHAYITWRYLPKADAVFFVTDSTESVLSQPEIDTIRRLYEFTGHIIFTQTKIDLVDGLQWEGWRDRNLEILQEKLGISREDIRYFALSNKLKLMAEATNDKGDLEDSGFIELMIMLEQDLLLRKQDMLAMPLLTRVENETWLIREEINHQVEILSMDSKAELDRMEGKFRTAQQASETFKEEKLPGILTAFHKSFDRASDHASSRVQRELEFSPFGPIVDPAIRQLDRSRSHADDLIAQALQTQSSVIADCNQIMTSISDEFDTKVCTAYDQAVHEISKEADAMLAEHCSPILSVAKEATFLRSPRSAFDSTRNIFFGVSVGGAVTATVAGFLFPPLGLAVAVCSVLGAIFGGWEVYRIQWERRRLEALQQLRNFLADTVRRVQQEARRSLEQHSKELRSDMITSLKKTLDRRDRTDRAAIKAIDDNRRQTREESAKQIKTLRDKRAIADLVLQSLVQANFTSDEDTRDNRQRSGK